MLVITAEILRHRLPAQFFAMQDAPPVNLEDESDAVRLASPGEQAGKTAPRLRSFVVRNGRMGPGQSKALARLGPRLLVPFADAPIDAETLYGRRAPLVVEIGFGMGAATAQIATAHPEVDYLGLEVHPPGIGALLARVETLGLGNVRIVVADAVEVLDKMIAPSSLAAIHIFFPDPWPKLRHHKRRLVQPAFVALAASRLAPGGTLHCATDWLDYAEQMLEVLGAEPSLVNAANGFADRPASRPLTKFEARGLERGHRIRDLLFRRRDSGSTASGIAAADSTTTSNEPIQPR